MCCLSWHFMISVKVSFNYCKAIARCSQSILSFHRVMKCHAGITQIGDFFSIKSFQHQMLRDVARLLQCLQKVLCSPHVWGIPLSRNLLKPHPAECTHKATPPIYLFRTRLVGSTAADQQMHNLVVSLHIWVISQYSASSSSWICHKNIRI